MNFRCIRHTEALEVEKAARLTLEKALERQAEATEQLDQRYVPLRVRICMIGLELTLALQLC